MVVKTLQVFFGGDCLPYKDIERKVHYPIVTPAFQGSSQVNEIKFYVDDIGVGAQWVACVKLPNGKLGYKLLETSSDELGTYSLFTLSSWFTQAKGDLYISLKGYAGGAEIIYDSESEIYKVSGDPIIQSTGAIKLTIQYATPIEESEYPDTFQEILALIYTKLDKEDGKYFKVVDNIANINSAEYADYLKGGDIVYSKNENATYVLSGTYPTLTYTKLLDFGDVVTLTTEQTISGNKTFTGDLYVNDISGAFWVGTTKTTDEPVYTEISRNKFYMRHDVRGVSLELYNYDGEYLFRIEDNGQECELYLPFESGTKILATREWTTTQISAALVSVYKPQGSASVSELNALTKTSSLNGYVYNVSNSGTLTNQDSSTLSVNIGDNVVFIWNNGSWYWDDLAGIVDLSGYVAKTTQIAGVQIGNGISSQDLTDALTYATTSDITSIMED